ncbi:hypothetical protein D1AOALGA4SA_10092 [Olavius algarvensis Delta 1 endosymbiont]|nr:hypothetical protein D1AOALGA4SA_10092 [Olavius algarvensis Delta 1 endosymbiont]
MIKLYKEVQRFNVQGSRLRDPNCRAQNKRYLLFVGCYLNWLRA